MMTITLNNGPVEYTYSVRAGDVLERGRIRFVVCATFDSADDMAEVVYARYRRTWRGVWAAHKYGDCTRACFCALVGAMDWRLIARAATPTPGEANG